MCCAASSTQCGRSVLPQQFPGLVLVVVLVLVGVVSVVCVPVVEVAVAVVEVIVGVEVVAVVFVCMHELHKTGQTDLIRSLIATISDLQRYPKPASQRDGESTLPLQSQLIAVGAVVGAGIGADASAGLGAVAGPVAEVEVDMAVILVDVVLIVVNSPGMHWHVEHSPRIQYPSDSTARHFNPAQCVPIGQTQPAPPLIGVLLEGHSAGAVTDPVAVVGMVP